LVIFGGKRGRRGEKERWSYERWSYERCISLNTMSPSLGVPDPYNSLGFKTKGPGFHDWLVVGGKDKSGAWLLTFPSSGQAKRAGDITFEKLKQMLTYLVQFSRLGVLCIVVWHVFL
jgi:hypothetical protein